MLGWFDGEHFNRKGLAAVSVDADTSDADRRATLQQLREGSVNVVFAKDLFNEGVDVPAVDAVLFLRPTESATLFLQQPGRGLRLDDGGAPRPARPAGGSPAPADHGLARTSLPRPRDL